MNGKKFQKFSVHRCSIAVTSLGDNYLVCMKTTWKFLLFCNAVLSILP